MHDNNLNKFLYLQTMNVCGDRLDIALLNPEIIIHMNLNRNKIKKTNSEQLKKIQQMLKHLDLNPISVGSFYF